MEEVKTPLQLLMGYEILTKKKGQPKDERAFLIQELCNVTGIDFKLLLRNTFHLKDEWGKDILRMILQDTLSYSSEREWRRWKCAELVRKSQGKKVIHTPTVAT